MNQIFKDQTNLTISLDTGLDLTGASETKILAKRPNGSKKEFAATPTGSVLSYQLADGDIDRAGIWKFQAYVVKGGKKSFGKIIEKVFLENLKN